MLTRSRSRFRGRAQPTDFLELMSFYGATDAWDFTTNTYLRNGVVGPSGITFTRASVGSYLNNNNTMTVFSSGQPRIGDKGLLIEGSRQNLFLNSAVGATQSITVTAAAHTLSFYGTGTVTLSGVSTDGPLVGTGEFDRVSLTFTPTAGSLTLTVSGDIKWVNLELGSFPSSWIPSDGTAVTRAADNAYATGFSNSGAQTLFAETGTKTNTGSPDVVWFSNGLAGTNNRILILRASLDSEARAFMASGGSIQAQQNFGTWTGDPQKFAARFDTDNVRGAVGGTLGTADTTATLPAAALDTFAFGGDGSTTSMFGYLRRVAIIPRSLSDAQLQEITT